MTNHGTPPDPGRAAADLAALAYAKGEYVVVADADEDKSRVVAQCPDLAAARVIRDAGNAGNPRVYRKVAPGVWELTA